MEQMAIATTLMSSVLHGALMGFLVGTAIIIFLHKRVQPIIVSVSATSIAVVGVLSVRVVWGLSRGPHYLGLGTSLQAAFWGWFFVALLVVIAFLQWLAWLSVEHTRKKFVDGGAELAVNERPRPGVTRLIPNRLAPLFLVLSTLLAACGNPTGGGGKAATAEARTVSTCALTSTEADTPDMEATSDEPVNTGSLHEQPIVPEVSEQAKEIYRLGVERGRNPQVFTKVGDCMTASEHYLFPFSRGLYDLGEHDYLQPVIDAFSVVTIRRHEGQPVDSFSNPSLTVACGFNSASPLEPVWANKNFCEPGEAPLTCELRVSNASFALLMLGTHDMYYTTEKFQGYLESIVEEMLGAGTVPILFTFPYRMDRLEDTLIYNQVVLIVAEDYHVPVANLWLALQELPNYGIEEGEVTKLSLPDDGCATCFTDDNLNTGATMQNLVAMRALFAVWTGVSGQT